MKKFLDFIMKDARGKLFQAQAGFVPLADLGSQSGKLSDLYQSGNLADYVNKIFIFAISIGAILAVVRFMYAGYLYMGSSDMWSNKKKATTVFGDVVFGLLLLLAVWLILHQINPDLLKLTVLQDVSASPVQTQDAGATGDQSAAPTGGTDQFGLPN